MQNQFPVIAVNGIIGAQVSPLDRGFMYGDGLFETCRLTWGKIPLWRLHRERLLHGLQSLRIKADITAIELQVQKIIESLSCEEAIIKITVTRGEGGRGYGYTGDIKPTVVIAAFPQPAYPAANAIDGVQVRICQQRLGNNTNLAGLKHLNRLEQVLARAEWNDNYIAEGLMFDQQGFLIEGVFSNIFLVKAGQLLTPDLSQAGVNGIMRRLILEKFATKSSVTRLSLNDVLMADEIFMCNSLYGIWPVKKIHGVEAVDLLPGPVTRQLQQQLADYFQQMSS